MLACVCVCTHILHACCFLPSLKNQSVSPPGDLWQQGHDTECTFAVVGYRGLSGCGWIQGVENDVHARNVLWLWLDTGR